MTYSNNNIRYISLFGEEVQSSNSVFVTDDFLKRLGPVLFYPVKIK